MQAQTTPRPSDDTALLEAGLLSYEAPFLVEKLLKEAIVSSAEEARALFDEVKRYLALCYVDRTRSWPMPSARVDEVWHQFVLFTAEYTAFCDRHFGEYRHHAPSNAPAYPDKAGGAPMATYEELAARYRALFGVDLPVTWSDELFVTPHRRLIRNDPPGATYTVRVVERKAELVATRGEQNEVLVRVDDWGAPALRFVAREDVFYVRELPPPLEDDDRVALCAALVRRGILRVAR